MIGAARHGLVAPHLLNQVARCSATPPRPEPRTTAAAVGPAAAVAAAVAAGAVAAAAR